MDKVQVVGLQVYSDSVNKLGVDNNIVDTCNRSVMENFDKDGVMFASAEYVKVPGSSVITTYRIKPEYIVTPEVQ